MILHALWRRRTDWTTTRTSTTSTTPFRTTWWNSCTCSLVVDDNAWWRRHRFGVAQLCSAHTNQQPSKHTHPPARVHACVRHTHTHVHAFTGAHRCTRRRATTSDRSCLRRCHHPWWCLHVIVLVVLLLLRRWEAEENRLSDRPAALFKDCFSTEIEYNRCIDFCRVRACVRPRAVERAVSCGLLAYLPVCLMLGGLVD